MRYCRFLCGSILSVFLLLSAGCLTGFAQARNIYLDSLENRLADKAVSVTEKAGIYNILIESHRTSDRYEQAFHYIRLLRLLADSAQLPVEQVKVFVHLGTIAGNKGEYDKARLYADTAELTATKSGNNLAKSYSSYLLAHSQLNLSESENVVKTVHKALSFLSAYPEEYSLYAKLNYFLYAVYTDWNNLDNSLRYARESVAFAERSNDKNLLSNTYTALAVSYTYQYEKSRSNKDLQLIIQTQEKAADLYRQFPGRVADFTFALARTNKADYQLRYYPDLSASAQQQIEKEVREVLDVVGKLKNSQPVVASALGILATLAKRNGDQPAEEQYLLEARRVLLTQQPVYLHTLQMVTGQLAQLYAEKGQFRKAYEYRNDEINYTHQLFDQDQAASVQRLTAQFQSQKREAEMKALEEKAESQRRQKLLYIGLGIAGLVGSFFMFRSYHFRLKYSLERAKQLSTEKSEAELLIKFQEEEQARLRIEQQLLEVSQQKLQDEVMASQLHIHHKNEVLSQLKETISGGTINTIQQILRKESLMDNDFEKAKFRIQEVHPHFFRNLNEKAGQKLTPLDLQYCAYLYLGMDTKQIASLLHVEPKSVRVTKYRLKKKFGLDEKDSLISFLQQSAG